MNVTSSGTEVLACPSNSTQVDSDSDLSQLVVVTGDDDDDSNDVTCVCDQGFAAVNRSYCSPSKLFWSSFFAA